MGGVPNNNHNYLHSNNQTVSHLESIPQRMAHGRNPANQELRAPGGNIIAFTGRPLENISDRYINPKIEEELKDFKKEIEEKFAKSRLKNYSFPLKKQMPKLPNPNMRSARYETKNNETERSEGNNSSIGGSVDRRGNNNSQFMNYQTYPLQQKGHGVTSSNSPNANQMMESPRSKRSGGGNLPGINAHGSNGTNSQLKGPNAHVGLNPNQQMLEQSRYNDIMRSINNTEQFIKAKQAEAAAQERQINNNGVSGRNYKKNINLTDIHVLANSTNSSFLNQQYSGGKSPFEQPISIRDPNLRR